MHGAEGTSVEQEAIYRAIAARQPVQARNEMANHLDCVPRELRFFVIRASRSP
jgi:DNA-binding FadR family transcriptional regulator